MTEQHGRPGQRSGFGGRDKRLVLALGGGGACGLAHIGVLDVLERNGIRIDCIVGSSMGGLIGALAAAGLGARDITELARDFGFPRWFILGRVVAWDSIFRSAVPILERKRFDELTPSLMLTATDLEAGDQIVLRHGPVLPSVRATCAIPGILPAVKIGGRWLVDGGLVNLVPVDVAWMANPNVVIAVNVGVTTGRAIPALDWPITSFLLELGRFLPNPATAKVCFEVLARAAEITIARQTTLATAMTGPDLLVEPKLMDIGLRDFDRVDDAIAAGRLATENALPRLQELLEAPSAPQSRPEVASPCSVDPVCGMVINRAHARATAKHNGDAYDFCSPNCRDLFERDPARYLRSAPFTTP